MQYDYSLSMTFRLPTFLSFWGLLYSLIALLELVPPCLGDWPRFYWSLGALPNWRRSGAPSSSLKFSVVLEIAPNICGLSCYQSVFDIFSLGLNPLELKILSWLLIFTHFWGISVATKSHPLTRIMPATDVSPVWTSSNLRGLCSLNELADVKWIMHTCMYKLSHSLNPKHTPTCFIHSAQVMFDGGGLHDPNALALLAPDCGSWGLPARYTSMRSYFNPFGCAERDFVYNGNFMVSRNFVLNMAPTHYVYFRSLSFARSHFAKSIWGWWPLFWSSQLPTAYGWSKTHDSRCWFGTFEWSNCAIGFAMCLVNF